MAELGLRAKEAGEAGGELLDPPIPVADREGHTEIKSGLIGGGLQLQLRSAVDLDRFIQGRRGETGHIGAGIEIAAIHRAGLQPKVAAAAGHGTPGVMHDHHLRPAAGALLEQLPFAGNPGGQSAAGQLPALPRTGLGCTGLPLPAAPFHQDRLLRSGGFLTTEVTPEEVQLHLIKAPSPVQVGPGTDAQQWGPARRSGTSPEIENAVEVWVMPAANDQHRPPPEL